jgi:hypothetical protein
MITLRDYQITNAAQGLAILKAKNIVYLAMEVRTGKTLTALAIAKEYGAKNVLFLTKKNAIASIWKDYQAYNPGYTLTVINDESMHKLSGKDNRDLLDYDLVVHDEHHRFSSFPKPGLAIKTFKKLFAHLPQIYLSGTPTPESYAQIYHQFWVSKFSPFVEKTFYKWAREYVNITVKRLPQGEINDYSDARIEAIAPIIEPYMVRFTQAQAGFSSAIDEEIIWIEPSNKIKTLCDKLIKDRVIIGNQYNITADSPVALQSKLHQLYSGTILFDEVEGQPRHAMTLDTIKAETILRKFNGQKIVIFYKFKQELTAIVSTLGDTVTTDLAEFQSTDKSIALQIVSGREGLNLSAASAIVYYNIDHAALSYWQGRDRLTTITSKQSKVYWVFSIGGLESKIYEAVSNKKDYTTNMFKADFGIKRVSDPIRHHQKV